MARLHPILLLPVLALVACGSSDDDDATTPSPTTAPTSQEATPTAAPTPQPEPALAEGGDLTVPENGLQLTNEPIIAPPGTETQRCQYLTVNLEGNGVASIPAIEAAQTAGSHHLILYYAEYTYTGEQPWADGIYDCNNFDDPGIGHRVPILITSLEQESLQFPKKGQTLGNPDKDVALLMPAGEVQLIIEQHIINGGDRPIQHHASINIFWGDERNPANYDAAYVYTWGPTDFQIPSNTPYTDGDILLLDTPDVDLNDDGVKDAYSTFDILYNFGHMHRNGIRYTFEFKPADSDEWQMLADDDDWAHPTVLKYTPNGILRVGVGAGLRMSCTWFNTSESVLQYPQEMCFSIGYLLYHAVPVSEVSPAP